MKTNQKVKLIIILAVEFIAISIILILIFVAGKRVYTVTFDLNGGTLLSGDPIQKVTQGQSATPPQVTKEGCFFLKWNGSYREVTRDVTIEAVWEYETTEGIEYTTDPDGVDSNYCLISGCYEGLVGEVYIGAYHNGKKVLGIKDGAFKNCEGITGIHLLDGILDIGNEVFAGCTNLKTIELPSTVVNIGDRIFANCENLETLLFPTELKNIGVDIFIGCTSLKEIELPENLEYLIGGAFTSCKNLTKITFPSSLEIIGEGAFENCNLLQEIIFHEESLLTKIEKNAFAGCSSLAQVTFPASLEIIGEGAFENCNLLNSVKFSEGITTVKSKAFAGCSSLKSVVLPLSLVNIQSGAFDQADLQIYAMIKEEDLPAGWEEGWKTATAQIFWEYTPPVNDSDEDDE